MLLGSENAGEVSADERAIAERFDEAFTFILRGRVQQARCDWGIDLADGPAAIGPNMRKLRTAANAVCLRARVALADGNQGRVRDELLAVSVMSRHAAADASLVATMMQVATELKILNFIAAHFEQLKPQTRSEISRGLHAPPLRATVADAMVNEKAGFCDWLVDALEAARAKDRNDTNVFQQFRAMIGETFKHESELADKIIVASGGTSEGVIHYIRAVDVYYKRADAIARTSGDVLKREMAKFETEINNSTNLLALVVMPNVGKARVKELEFEARLAKLPNAAP